MIQVDIIFLCQIKYIITSEGIRYTKELQDQKIYFNDNLIIINSIGANK